ncbi:hypothetical protein OG992_18690 [Micromonospora sp. NBC_00362]|uniref:hypothetical protein n=1 Tax=Micromonospora sp. NBC_00362 TaxID=2975975 RepID=UPI00225737FA|nr:hypothetical protein [Micromonospora sp. NBC_00362]MCX5119217.1 hypothetical protein [Micromonospora sp. NBC_00362]
MPIPAGPDPTTPGQIIRPTDLPASLQGVELIDAMVAGANAKASRVAPCLASTDPLPTADQVAEAKLILLGAVKRWAEAGSGAWQQQTAGPYSVTSDTRQRSGFNLWPSEIEALQALCRTSGPSAFTVDTAPGCGSIHSPICSLNFGALYCSCGADIAGFPLYELVDP